MAKQIESLTKEQEALLDVYAQKWIKIGLCTDPIDRPVLEAAITRLYEYRGYKAPETFEYYDGFKEADMKKFPQLSLWGGQMSAHWLGFQEFFLDQFGIAPESAYLIDVAKAGGFVHFETDKCVIVERPEVIKMNDQNVLHCENGPAIRFKDGFEVYMWNGTRVPKDWIMNKADLDPAIALNHENIEMRRIAAEIIGWNIVLEKMNYRVIDEDADAEIGTLLEVNIPDVGTERFLRVMCGTKREFAMPVPPTTKTAMEAQAWMLGFDSVEEFMPPEIRT